MPDRGRVLQVDVEGHGAYWTRPEAAGWNVGGDRLWVGPERAWIWTQPDSTEPSSAELPSAMDPGAWSIVNSDDTTCRVTQSMELRHRHEQASLRLQMDRTFRHVEVPTEDFRTSIAYQTENCLTIIGGDTAQPVSLWHMVQVPPGGNILIPLEGEPVRSYFEPTPPGYQSMDGGLLRVRVDGKSRFKGGISPERTLGRQAYVRPIEDGWLVFYRRFTVEPWRDYCDAPMTDASGQGDALQFYNDDGNAGGFGEVEYHSPSIALDQTVTSVATSDLTIVGTLERDALEPWCRRWLLNEGWPASMASTQIARQAEGSP